MVDSSQILQFPVQLADPEEGLESLDDYALILQARLHATKLMAGIQEGRIPPEAAIIQNIKNLNQHLVDFGEPSLDIGFLDNLEAQK